MAQSAQPAAHDRVLVVGMGNDLRQDDGFGIAVVRRLAQRSDLPPGAIIMEAGIAGVRVVQELLDGYAGLVIVDAVDRGEAPGTLYELEPRPVTNHSHPGHASPPAEGRGTVEARSAEGALESLHTVEPSRILTLARAAGCLPDRVLIVGCQPQNYDELVETLTPPVAAAVHRAVALIVQRLRDWLSHAQSAPCS